MATELRKRREERRKSQREKAIKKLGQGGEADSIEMIRSSPLLQSIRQSLHRSIQPSLIQRSYAGTSSSWSMSRLWNSMKKGLGAVKPVESPKPIVSPMSAANKPRIQSTTPSATDAIWEPLKKSYTAEEIRRFEVETPMFRCSPQKLADLGRQLSGLPLDAAVLQLRFSPKKAAGTLYNVLTQAQANARLRGKEPSEYVVREAVTGRGKYLMRLDIKGRGRCGTIKKPHAFMRFVLEIPNVQRDVSKLLRIKTFPRENKPAYIKLDY